MGAGDGLRFGLSRTLGRQTAFDSARTFAATLDRVGFGTVVPFDRYEDLEAALLAGDVHAAWAPPLICARVEDAGGHVALRAIRNDMPTYGSAVLRDAHYHFDIAEMPAMSGLRAAWVDLRSMGGYLLPRHALRRAGVDLAAVFAEEKLLGSYSACLLAVVAGKADVTACFFSGSGDDLDHGFRTMLGKRARFVEVLTLSEQGPHDGLALTPAVRGSTRSELLAIFGALPAAELSVLARAFRADSFDTPPPGSYLQVLDLLTAPA